MKRGTTRNCTDKKKRPTRVRRQSVKGAGAKESAAKQVARLDSQAIRQHAVNAILKAVPKITRALIKQAEEGNHLPAKFLFDFSGIAEPADGSAENEESLAAILIRALREAPADESPAKSATSAPVFESVTVSS